MLKNFNWPNFFKMYHKKIEAINFPSMYNTYRVSVQIWRVYPGEGVKSGNVNKIRRCKKFQQFFLS